MIAVDTSALMAILQKETEAGACRAALEGSDGLLISAVTMVESLIVAAGRGASSGMRELLRDLPWEVVPVTAANVERVAAAHLRWGRGAGTAGLNFGDCFAYEVAQYHGCPLLFVGKDFAKTDVRAAIRAR